MTELADRTIDLLRRHHDELAARVADLTDDDLARTSGATGWTVAQVLSHLGSGAEIGLGVVRGDDVDNEAVWARWDAATPREQATAFVEHDAAFVTALEALDAETRTTATVDLGFMPEPLPLGTYVGMRAVEVVNHAWDVREGLDGAATLDEPGAELLAEHYAGPLAFMLGFSAKPDQLAEPATVVLGDSGFALELGDGVTVTTTPSAPTATFLGPVEAGVRLLTGRLRPDTTPEGVDVTGNVTLEDLRKVFPGY